MPVRLKSLGGINSVELFSLTSTFTQSLSYFLILVSSGLVAAGEYSYILAISGLSVIVLRPQIWMHLLSKSKYNDHEGLIFRDLLIQTILLATLLPLVLALRTNWGSADIALISAYSIFVNNNFSHACIRFKDKYSWISAANLVSAAAKMGSIYFLPFRGHESIIIFLFIDVCVWAVIFALSVSATNMKSGTSRYWNSSYFWSWLQGLSELPVASLDRILLGLISFELLGIFAFYKQIVSLFGMLNTYFGNKYFAVISEHSENQMAVAHPFSTPFLMALCVSIMLLAIALFGFVSEISYIYNAMPTVFILFLFWSALTVPFYYVHLLMFVSGRARESFVIHVFANVIYLFLLWSVTRSNPTISMILGALFFQQVIVILGKYFYLQSVKAT